MAKNLNGFLDECGTPALHYQTQALHHCSSGNWSKEIAELPFEHTADISVQSFALGLLPSSDVGVCYLAPLSEVVTDHSL